MDSANVTFLINLIPPAVGVAILAYLTRFFGKIITDQNPFADSREWEVELAGTNFMINLSIGVVGIAAALYWLPWNINTWWEHSIVLFILSLISGIFLLGNVALSGEFFKLGQEKVQKLTEDKRWIHDIALKVGKYIPLIIPPIFLFYIATIEYLSGSILWIIVIWSIIFYTLIQMAYNFSLRKLKRRTGVDIYFTDNSESLKDVIILKVNPDNIRLRTHDHHVFIINKSLIAKIDQLVPEDMR
jgi:hypothetical protein